MSNKSFIDAKRNKNDEFYTQYDDIEDELSFYIKYNPNLFANKTVLLPCDNYKWSNFTKYFLNNFERLKLKKLISTSYEKEDMEDFLSDSPRGGLCLIKDAAGVNTYRLESDGDFLSREVSLFKQEADFIITNPPFSLFRKFIDWCIDDNKQFLVIGMICAFGYKKIFNYFCCKQIRPGARGFGKDMRFQTPAGDTVKFGNTCWFTNMDNGVVVKPLKLNTYEYNIKHAKCLNGDYKKYDNYDAIDIPRIKLIPSDYRGVMGTPLTIIEHFCWDQFELVGIAAELSNDGIAGNSLNKTCSIDGKELFSRIFIKNKLPSDN